MDSSAIRHVNVSVLAAAILAVTAPAHAFKSKYYYDVLHLCDERQSFKIRYPDEFYLRENKAGKMRPAIDLRSTIDSKGKYAVHLVISDPNPGAFYDTVDFKYLYLERTRKDNSEWGKWRRISKNWKSAKIKSGDWAGIPLGSRRSPDRWVGTARVRIKSSKTRQIMVKVRLPADFHLNKPNINLENWTFDLQVTTHMACEDKKPAGSPPSSNMPFLNTDQLRAMNCRRQNWCLDNGYNYIPGLGCCQ